jgi:hypothetical protein
MTDDRLLDAHTDLLCMNKPRLGSIDEKPPISRVVILAIRK